MFRDRTDGGEQLAELLLEEGVTVDIVLAIPRGGLPAGRAVADALDVPLDVVAARKMGAPDNPELAIGAVGASGAVWLNEDLIDSIAPDREYVERERERQAEAASEKLDRYRGGQPDLEGQSVLLVDDGVATGATMIACVREARAAGASRVVVGVPVGSPSSIETLREEADAVYAVETPEHFSAVGQFYRQFDQVTDEEAMTYLS